jgi:hypothetical protein
VVHLVRARIAVVPWLAALALGAGACSLIVDTDAAQCHADRDCVRFGAMCDLTKNLCVARAGADARVDSGPDTDAGFHDADAGGTGDADAATDLGVTDAAGTPDADASTDVGPPADGPMCRTSDGCRPCPAGATTGLANACSDVTCVPFDNHARLRNLTADGGLRPLP